MSPTSREGHGRVPLLPPPHQTWSNWAGKATANQPCANVPWNAPGQGPESCAPAAPAHRDRTSLKHLSAVTPTTHLIYHLSPQPQGSWRVPGSHVRAGTGGWHRGWAALPGLRLFALFNTFRKEKKMSEAPSGYARAVCFKAFPEIPSQWCPFSTGGQKRGKKCVKWHFYAHTDAAACRGQSYSLVCFSQFAPLFLAKPHFGTFLHERGWVQLDEPWGQGQRCGHRLSLPRCHRSPTGWWPPTGTALSPALSPAHSNAFRLACGLG